MGIEGKSFSVKVIDNVVVHAHEPCNNHWLPFTNLDLLVAPFDVGSFSFATRNLPMILWNVDARENQIHCNNRGVDFTEAVADVQLKQLNLYNPDESIEGKLMPKKLHGVLAIQVTELKCGGMVIGCMFDHRAADGYSANMFISSWADITRSGSPSMLPSFNRLFFNPRFPTTYSSSIDDVFAIFEPPTKSDHDQNHDQGDLLINRVYYVEGEQLSRVQSLATENERSRSKVEAFTSFLWKTIALSMEDSGNSNKMCSVALAVDGRRRLFFNPRFPTTYSSSIDDVFAIFEPPTKSDHDQNHDQGDLLINRVYYVEGEQLSRVQSLATENERSRSKVEAFTSFLWKTIALSMEDSGNSNKMCSVALAVDGRRRLSEGDGEETEKSMISHFGNVLSIPSGSIRSQELKGMSLSEIATEVHEFLQIATTKEHFVDLIDWVEERRSQPLVARAFASRDMSVMISSGQRFQIMDKMDFGWGKVAFGSCHVPSSRKDCYVMTLPSPTKNEDYIEKHANHMFKPMNTEYLQI
ncbi:transferase, Chloramphenicol acetyltransferase-like domain protein [Artemisia annua]|uniref:Transferase, Chloramphenicol acetyltransferase-like domain protein n=1 Tax=Artemisia annua TaxID=35608 RepID=A0A2U1NJ00_ARTAN|nr:transferase, Chloramphenicol acetyltransferase-like domain protein [Artemisia annua]